MAPSSNVQSVFSQILGWFQVGILLAAGLGGFVILVADQWSERLAWLHVKEKDTYILLLLASLAVALGIERATLSRDLVRNLDDQGERQTAILNQLQLPNGTFRRLEGYDEVYDTACTYLKTAKQEVRSLVGPGKLTVSDKYRATLISVLAESKKQNRPIYDQVIITADSLPPEPALLSRMRERNSYYRKEGVDDLIQIRLVVMPPLFDLLIIDDKHVILSYRTAEGAKTVQSGIAFINQPEVAQQMSRWFDSTIKPKAVPAEDYFSSFSVDAGEKP